MASVRSTIDLIITGSTRGLNAAAAQARTMAERIAAAEDRVSDARTRSAAAEERVEVVEQRLNAARAQQEAALSRVGVAETNLARTREASLGSTTRLSQAQADLDAVRSRSGATAEEVARAEARVTQVRQEADRSAAALQRSEAALATARGNADRSSARVRQAEADIARARSEAVRASEALARSENDLGLLRRRGTTDLDRQRSGILGVFDAFSRLGQAFSGADGASTSLLSKMAALNSVFSSIGGPIVQTVVGILELVAALGAAGEIIGVVGGLIGQVLGSAPAILVALGAAALTVQLGMDGIKQAAQAAAPAFEKLKASVSGVFARELTPFFQRIGQILPQLTAGFDNVAVSVSQVAKEIIATTTSARGLAVLNGILSGTATLFRTLAPGVAVFVKGLLDAANVGQTAFAALGAAIGSVFQRIGDVLTRLAGDGTISRAVQGLAATISGLGAVIAPVIDLLIQMGAALGASLGAALTDLGLTIQSMIPFFVHLAQVAGDLLVSAFQQLGPAIRDVIVQLLPGANQGLDGFANVIKTVVLPAIADFIRNIPGMINAIKLFFLSATANALSFASSFLAALSSTLEVLHGFFATLALIPGPMQESFAKAAAATAGFKTKVDELKAGVDGLHDKTVKAEVQTAGGPQVVDMKNQIALINSKKVDVTANTPDTPKVVDMRNQIALTNSKKVDVTANVQGTSAIQEMVGWIGRVVGKTVNIVANVIGAGARFLGFADGGRVPTSGAFLVGERGPEIVTLDGLGAQVTPAARTRQMLSSRRSTTVTRDLPSAVPGSAAGSAGPITVNVMLSQEQIAGIAQVEIARRDRATKRTVLAGSGVTF